MKKQTLLLASRPRTRRADGGRGTATRYTLTPDHLPLLTLVSQINEHTVYVEYTHSTGWMTKHYTCRVDASNEQWAALKALLSIVHPRNPFPGDTLEKYFLKPGRHGLDLIQQDELHSYAAAAKAIIVLARDVVNHTETYTIDPAYAGAAHILTETQEYAGHHVTVNYAIPFDQERYKQEARRQIEQQQHNTTLASLELQAANDRLLTAENNKTAAENNKTAETLIGQTTASKTLRYIGAAAVAAALIAAIALLVKKTKK